MWWHRKRLSLDDSSEEGDPHHRPLPLYSPSLEATMTRVHLPNTRSGVVCYVGTHRNPAGLWLDGFHVFTLEPTKVAGKFSSNRLNWVGVYANAKTAAANARGL